MESASCNPLIKESTKASASLETCAKDKENWAYIIYKITPQPPHTQASTEPRTQASAVLLLLQFSLLLNSALPAPALSKN